MSDKTQTPPPMIRPMGRGPGPGHGPMIAEKPENAGKTLKRLVRYIGKSKYLFFSLLIVMIFITMLQLAGPALQGAAIDAITVREGNLQIDISAMTRLLALLLCTYVLTSVCSYVQGVCAAKLSQSTVYVMRKDLFSKIEHLPIRYVDTHQHGDIMSRMTNDVENISNTISQSIASLFSGFLTIVGTVLIMLCYSPLLTLVSMVTIVLSLLATSRLSGYMRKYFSRLQRLTGRLNGHIEEMVTGYKTVVAFEKEEKAEKEFDEISGQIKKCGIRAQIFGGIMGPMMNVISNFGYLVIAAFGGWLALTGAIGVGTIQSFLLYSKQFTRPINELANQYAQIQTAIAGAERVFAIMDTPSEPDEGNDGFRTEEVRGDIDFEQIQFSYVPDEPVLLGFDLEVKQGQKIALVGATGSGKTTVVNLLTRFYDIDAGTIRLDGVDIRRIPKAELRKSIAIVLQDTVIFSDSIAQNIRYGRLEATREEIIAAAKVARVDDFAAKLAQGYDTLLSEGGGNLSQGQRQLISIARAVLANPKILILDEATSNIDTRTELHIQEAMIALMKNRTSLIIAHRLSTIRDADKIIVLDGGRIAEAGSHEELLLQKGRYYQLYQNQFAGIAT